MANYLVVDTILYGKRKKTSFYGRETMANC